MAKPKMKKKLKDKVPKKGAKKQKTVAMKESLLIANFLKCVSEKNYSAANKYLKGLVETKLKSKIAQHIDQNIF